MQEPPANLKTAAVIQLVSGVITLFIMTWLGSCVLGSVGGIITGICTLGIFPIGGLCGFLSFLLIPVGILEIASGIMGLANPQGAGGIMKVCAIIEIIGFFFGGLSTAIAGAVAMKMLGDPEVVAYIEG